MEENKPIEGSVVGGAAVTQPPAGKNTLMAFVAYILFFVPLLTESKNDPFVKFHVKQSLGLLLCWVLTIVVGRLPFVWIAMPFLQLAVTVLWIFGLVYALQGKQQALPLVGQYFEKINI